MTVDQAVARLAVLLSDRGLTGNPADLRTLVRDRRDSLANALGITPSSAMRHFTEDALTAMADSAVDALADEEPGRPPWERPDTHLLPVSTAARLTWGLIIAATVNPDHAQGPLEAAAAYQRRIMEGALTEPISTIAVPAQVLNWSARLLEVTAGQEALFHAGTVRGEPAEIRRAMLTDAAEARALALSPGTADQPGLKASHQVLPESLDGPVP